MFKKLLLVFLAGIFFITLTACGPKEKTGTAYGIVYKDYVGISTVTVLDNKVENATFDEVFLPYSWARVKVGTDVPDDVIVAVTTRGTYWYGKYLVIGDKKFTGTLREAPTINGVTYTNQVVKYSAEGIDDLHAWLLQSEENCKWYADQMTTGKGYVTKADWTKSDYETAGNTTPDGKLGFTKSSTGYWSGPNYELGWPGNMAEIVKVIKGTKMDASVDNIVKGGTENKYWVVNGVVSGATLGNFKDYYLLAKKAYNNGLK